MDRAQQRGFAVFAADEPVALQHLLDAAVEAFDPAVGLRMDRRGEAVFDAEVSAQAVKVMLAGSGTLAQAEQSVGEFLAIIGQNARDPHRASPLEIA